MKVLRKIIEIDEEMCDGCGLCVPSCAEGALEIVDGKVRMIADKLCDGLGACLGDCPTGALKVVEREVDEFDEEAVEEHLEKEKKTHQEELSMPCGCPSANLKTFATAASPLAAKIPTDVEDEIESALSHWPVQITLIPPHAPFLKGADLLVLADCVPVAFPHLHRDFLPGKAVTMGCPKLDDAHEYIEKFAEIFKTANINSITSMVVEVPCCSGLPMIVKKALEISGKQIPIEEVVISVRGKILERTRN